MSEILPGQVIDIIKSADTVQVFLGCSSADEECNAKAPKLFPASIAVREGSGPLDHDAADKLRSLMLDPDNYMVYQTPGARKPCAWLNSVFYLFGTDRGRVAIQVAPSCWIAIVYTLDHRIVLNVDYMAEELAQFNLEVFPEDDVVAEDYARTHEVE